MKDRINYNVDDLGILVIWLGNRVLAEVGDCYGRNGKDLENIVDNTLYGMGYKWNDDGTVEKM